MPTNDDALIPVVRGVYRLRSRNLTIGVYTELGIFIGIREKFDHRYLDAEVWNRPPEVLGTAVPLERLGTLPAEIAASEDLGTACRVCGEPADYVRWGDLPSNGFPGRWCHVDAQGVPIADAHEPNVWSVTNEALFEFLDALDPAAPSSR